MGAQSRKLRKKVLAALAVLVLAALAGQIVVGAIISRPSQVVAAQSKDYADTAKQVLELAILQKHIQINVIQVQQFLQDVSATRGLDGLDDGFAFAKEHAVSFGRNVNAATLLAKQLGATETVKALGDVERAFPDYYAMGERMAQAYVDGGPAAGNASMAEFDAVSERIQNAVEATQASIDHVLKQIDSSAETARADLASTMQVALAVAGGVVTVTTVLGVAIAVMIMRQLLNPLGRTTAALNALAAGRSDTEVTGAERTDEMGDLARAFMRFKQQAEEKQAADSDAVRRQEIEQERERNAACQAAAIEMQQATVAEIGRGLSNLADGNLTYRISGSFPQGYEKLKVDFNAAMDSIESTIAAITEAGHAIRSDTSDISRAAEDLSMRTEEQATSLEETVAALGQITGNVRRTAEGAGHARQLVDKAKARAEESGQVVAQAITAMAGIENASREISGIIGVIEEIAFQTNLLALNAGVEAARAGDTGRGFAVVAQEVRSLAQRSATAAKEITALISGSNRQVSHGVDLVSRSGQALSTIVVQVNDLTEIVRGISGAADEQASSLTEINVAIGQMDQMTQQNAAIAEQSTAASLSLHDKADGLTQLIGQFRVGAARTSTQKEARSHRLRDAA